MRLSNRSIEWQRQAGTPGAPQGGDFVGGSSSVPRVPTDLRWVGQLIGIGSSVLTGWCAWMLACLVAGSL